MARGGRQRGFNLIELMVSLTLGLLLLAAFVSVLQTCRRQFAVNESLAGLQDAARHVLSVIVPELEHAGLQGFSTAARPQLLRAGVLVASAEDLRQPDGAHAVAPAAGLPAGAHDCGINFAVDLELAVQAANHAYPVGTGARDCAPTASAGGARAGSDTLTVRHASLQTTKARAGRVQLYSKRLDSHAPVTLFADGVAPGPSGVDAEIRDLEVRSYYISNNSVGRAGWPALRVKALTESRGAAQFRDEEILPGVEDLQVEFGLRDPQDPESPLKFVAPDAPGLREQQVVAVRVWLRIRADRTEGNYDDPRELQYADVHFVPNAAEARLRRLLVERTVALRNLPTP